MKLFDVARFLRYIKQIGYESTPDGVDYRRFVIPPSSVGIVYLGKVDYAPREGLRVEIDPEAVPATPLHLRGGARRADEDRKERIRKEMLRAKRHRS